MDTNHRDILLQIAYRILVQVRSLTYEALSQETNDHIKKLSDLGHNIPLWINGAKYDHQLFLFQLDCYINKYPDNNLLTDLVKQLKNL